MAPIVSDLKHKESGTARVLGSGTSGMLAEVVGLKDIKDAGAHGVVQESLSC